MEHQKEETDNEVHPLTLGNIWQHYTTYILQIWFAQFPAKRW